MGNSLREVSNELDTKLNELRQSIPHPNNRNKLFILLEGESDIKFFRKIFNIDLTDTTAINGKEKLKNILIILLENHNNIIGIKDADFDNLENSEVIENLFITDFHDIEIEMIKTGAFDSILSEFSTKECYEKFKLELKDNVYEIAMILGYLRWYNERKGQNILFFKGLNFNEFVEKGDCTLIVDEDKLFEAVISHTKKKENSLNITVDELKEEIQILKEISEDRLQICCGHDLTKLISMIFKANMNNEKIEEALRLSYRFEYFKDTKLYTDLKNWLEENSFSLEVFNR